MNRLTSPSAHTSRGGPFVPDRRFSITSLPFTIASVANEDLVWLTRERNRHTSATAVPVVGLYSTAFSARVLERWVLPARGLGTLGTC